MIPNALFSVEVAIRVRVVLTNEYSTIWVNTNPTRSLNRSKFLNPNTTYLLNRLVVSTHLSDFIKAKKITNFSINQIDLNYEKKNFNMKFRTKE